LARPQGARWCPLAKLTGFAQGRDIEAIEMLKDDLDACAEMKRLVE
jgi:hypothetical protein